MGSGHHFEIEAMRDGKKNLHPAWAAVGCFTVVGLSTAGYLLGGWLIEMNSSEGWLLIPGQLAGPAQSPYLFLKLVSALIVLLFGTAVFSIVYTLINPPKPGKYDVIDPSIFPPPPKRRK
ncbi:MAG: hypothetical protein JW929_07420 [Anaerolineales bacterium]|nr:hypothetical protein [Anaerolineales bacterium]